MSILVHDPVFLAGRTAPAAEALVYRDQVVSYLELAEALFGVANGLLARDVAPGERVATLLPRQPEAVYGLFGATAAGACMVPVNPLLKPQQVAYILAHCNVRVLITTGPRARALEEVLAACPDLHTLVLVDDDISLETPPGMRTLAWQDFTAAPPAPPHRRIDSDMAAILYTSGSTGRPKGVALSHRNMVAGAESVVDYLGNSPQDRILAVLPLSFDAGLSQLTTAFTAGACVVLIDYLLPSDVIRAAERHRITGITAVPSLWNQLARMEWPEGARRSLRYIANTGGAMPVASSSALGTALPDTDIYLMYGLTEAFRSTYLAPEEVSRRPDSIGRAIPNAEILVVRDDGRECAPDEPGELVHRGALVALGYWNDPAETARRFRPSPGQAAELPVPELAVWSGDRVRRDPQGYLYFIGRDDDLIKTSGYRVSPSEIEEVAYASGLVAAAAAFGVPHPMLGQAILLAVSADSPGTAEDPGLEQDLLNHCRRELPNFMVPLALKTLPSLPHNQNGKIDRRALRDRYDTLFQSDTAPE